MILDMTGIRIRIRVWWNGKDYITGRTDHWRRRLGDRAIFERGVVLDG
jgi:hypothetical protein